jgi:hypothetical protein
MTVSFRWPGCTSSRTNGNITTRVAIVKKKSMIIMQCLVIIEMSSKQVDLAGKRRRIAHSLLQGTSVTMQVGIVTIAMFDEGEAGELEGHGDLLIRTRFLDATSLRAGRETGYRDTYHQKKSPIELGPFQIINYP